jgi:hypothetical protein
MRTIAAASLSLALSLTLVPIVATMSGCERAAAPTSLAVTAGGKRFDCRLALDEASRERGLGGVTEIGPDEGMLFAFPTAEERTFWMRDCVIDLDIAFLDGKGFVTAVHTMPKEPLRAEGESESAYLGRLKRYPSGAPAQFALEVAPGSLEKLGVRRGSRVEFDAAALKAHIR